MSAEKPDLTGLDDPLRELVARAMDKDAARRPSARTLLLALVGEVEDPLAAGTRIVQTGWTPPPATTVEATHLAEPEPEPGGPPTRPGRRRGRRPAVVAALVAVLGLALSGAWISQLGDRPDRDGLSAEPSVTGPAPAVSPHRARVRFCG